MIVMLCLLLMMFGITSLVGTSELLKEEFSDPSWMDISEWEEL